MEHPVLVLLVLVPIVHQARLSQLTDVFGNNSFIEPTEFRSIEGTGNNMMIDDMGSMGSKTARCVPADYGDGYNAMAGEYRYNPRELSNVLSSQSPEDSSQWLNDRNLTQFAWQWGQFLDHDISMYPTICINQ